MSRANAGAARSNAARILDRAKVPYQLREYDPDAVEAEPRPLAEAVAEQVGLPPAQVFKTLVVKLGSAPALAVVPASAELDLKATAAALGGKKAAMAPLAEVQGITGYVRGGVTALGCKRRLPVLLDASAQGLPLIAVSAGVRGAQLLLDPAAYATIVNARWAKISR